MNNISDNGQLIAFINNSKTKNETKIFLSQWIRVKACSSYTATTRRKQKYEEKILTLLKNQTNKTNKNK